MTGSCQATPIIDAGQDDRHLLQTLTKENDMKTKIRKTIKGNDRTENPSYPSFDENNDDSMFKELEKLGYKKNIDAKGKLSYHFINSDGETITFVNSLGKWLYGKSIEEKVANGFYIKDQPLTQDEERACETIIERLRRKTI